jgi:hypothetical protein
MRLSKKLPRGLSFADVRGDAVQRTHSAVASLRQPLLNLSDPRLRYATEKHAFADGGATKEKGAAKAPLSQIRVEAYFGVSLASAPSFGAPVPDEPMNSLRPSGNVTSRPLALQIGVQALSFDW